MKCDAGIHEETCTHVVLSCDTTMFQDIGEHMPTTSAPERCRSKSFFQQSLICTEASVFHDGDADVHEQICTYVVLSGDTTMFQDIGEHMPTTSVPETMQIKVI